MTDAKQWSHTTPPGVAVTPEQAIAAWHKAAIQAGFVPVGKAEVSMVDSDPRSRRIVGPVMAFATVPELAELDSWFDFHPPGGPDDLDAYQSIREAGRQFALVIFAFAPSSRERALAWGRVREAVMWANAARACNPPATIPTARGKGRVH